MAQDLKQKITPCLWFDMNCQEAIDFYTSIFPNSKINMVQKYPDNVDDPVMEGMAGKIITAIFELNGFQFMALDGGPLFKLNPSISFFLNFDPKSDPNAKESLDKMWKELSDGGEVLMELQEYPFSKHYGWCKDKFGVSWQLILTNPGGEDRPFIVPSMLFVNKVAGKAEEAINFYTSLFSANSRSASGGKNSKVGNLAKYLAGMEPDQAGSIMYGDFMLEGQWFAAMDSAREHKFDFNEAISLVVDCQDQSEVDYFWDKMTTDGGQESQCGWLKDKYGVSWQITPKRLGELLSDPDKEKSGRAMKAMLEMKKLDIAKLEEAYEGKV